MKLSITKRITLFWTALILGVAMLFIADEIPLPSDQHGLRQYLFLIPTFAALIQFKRLYRDFPPPRWVRVWGMVVWTLCLVGIPFLVVSRRPDAIPPLFGICLAITLGAFFLAVTAYAFRHREDGFLRKDAQSRA
jgi:hypothetical protein